MRSAPTSITRASNLSLSSVATTRIWLIRNWRRSTTSAASIYYNTGLVSARHREYRSFSHFHERFPTLAVFSENIFLHFIDQTGCDRCFRKFPSSHLSVTATFKTYWSIRSTTSSSSTKVALVDHVEPRGALSVPSSSLPRRLRAQRAKRTGYATK